MSTPTVTERAARLLSDPQGEALARHIIEYDPDNPAGRLFAAVDFTARAKLEAIPWPAGLAPKTVTPPNQPSPEAALPKADVLVVTWTVAEAKALADVLTPGHGSAEWSAYRHGLDAVYRPLIRKGAPALVSDRLAIYAQCEIGAKSVLCVKSELHLSQDGPELPVRKLWGQMIEECGAKLVITTGTAGGVGAQTQLGDVVLSKTVQFDCKRTFKNAAFGKASYTDGNPMGAASKHFTTAEQTLIPVNAGRLPAAAKPPTLVRASHGSVPAVLTTDFFAFDDTTDHYGLRAYNPSARAVEMGDAVLGLVCAQDLAKPPAWVVVRNASDPQMNGAVTPEQQASEAAHIYEKYGYWTTVGSAIACWAVIAA